MSENTSLDQLTHTEKMSRRDRHQEMLQLHKDLKQARRERHARRRHQKPWKYGGSIY